MSTEVLREHRGVTVSTEVLPTATWHDVAPLLARWQMALVPAAPGLWTVTSGWPSASGGPRYAQRRVPFAALPAAIADVAARCEQEEKDQAR